MVESSRIRSAETLVLGISHQTRAIHARKKFEHYCLGFPFQRKNVAIKRLGLAQMSEEGVQEDRAILYHFQGSKEAVCRFGGRLILPVKSDLQSEA